MNVFYFNSFNEIGGVESYLYYIAKKYGKYNITVYYSDPNSNQLQIKRLKKYVQVKRYNGEKIKCKKAFWNYQPLIIDNVEAEEHIQVIHANYLKQPGLWHKYDKINKYVAVSKDSAKAFTKLTGIKCEVAYIPIEYDKMNKCLIITVAQRNDSIKGINRLLLLNDRLNSRNIPHLILVFSNSTKVSNNNIIYMGSKLNVLDYIQKSDYFFCASDYEAYGLSKVEALSVGVPVIRTPLEVDKELGIDETNSIVLDFDCENIDEVIDKMLNTKWNFKYTPVEDKWDKYISKEKTTYKYKPVKIRCIMPYQDLEENQYIIKDTILEVDEERAKYLVEERKLCKYE